MMLASLADVDVAYLSFSGGADPERLWDRGLRKRRGRCMDHIGTPRLSSFGFDVAGATLWAL